MIFFSFFVVKIGDFFFTKRNIVAIYSLLNSIFRILAKFCTNKKNAAPNHELLGCGEKKCFVSHLTNNAF
jgi:hypothetical protein